MKRRNIIHKPFALVVLLTLFLFFLFKVEPLRCENKSDSINAQYQAKVAAGRAEDNSDPEWKDDKSRRFRELEWIITQVLIKSYEKLAKEDQEDMIN